MLKHTFLALGAGLALAFPVAAQDATNPGQNLPEICTKDSAAQLPEQPDAMAPDMSGSDQAHQDLMGGMGDMDKNMAKGMMAKDIDVAFVCGMIPHHQGAIDMAKAELAHGDDPWAKEMAQKIIDAQEKEIADMLNWLKDQK